MSHHEIFNLLFVTVLYILILDDLEVINVTGSRQSVHGGAGLFEIAGDFHSRILVEDIKAFILTSFVASIYIKLGQQALPSIVYLPLAMLLLLECVKCFLRLARVSVIVILDFENCRLPKRVNPYSIYRNIRVHFEYHGYFGIVIIRAYRDTNSLASGDLRALNKTIDVIHVNPGNDAGDKRIMVDLPFLARADMSPGTFMLIYGDTDFVCLAILLVQRVKIFALQSEARIKTFHSLANMVCSWPDIVTQKPIQLLLMSAASASHPSDNSISNVIEFQYSTREQTVVSSR